MAQTKWQIFLDTWGTVPIGNSRFSVRSLVLAGAMLLVVFDAMMQKGTRAIIALSLNLAFVVAAILVSKATRTISFRVLVYCFTAGIAMMGLAHVIAWGIVSAIGETSPLRPYLVAPVEDVCRLLPVLLVLLKARKFTIWTLGASDVALMGAASGAGFAFIEDCFAVITPGADNPFWWVPATVMYNGHLIAGHAVWSTLAACTIGFGLLFVRNRQWCLGLMVAGFAWALLDHVALDAFLQSQNLLTGILTFFAGNGYLTLLLFVAGFLGSIFFDLWLCIKVPPDFPEFRLPTKQQRSESISTVWQFLLDRRRLAYALYRQRALPNDANIALASSIVAQSLINYHRGAQVKQEAARAKAQVKQATGIESGARFNNPALAAASLGNSSTVRLGDDQQLPAGADYSRVPFSQAVDAISGGGRRPFDMADPTMNLGDLNRTHTPAPASGGGELMPELKLPGQYIILSQLSAGGMGIIYRAKHRHTGANLAIKVLHPHIAKQAVNVIRFEQEAKAACALNHPNLVVVHDFGVTPDAVPYLVMDLIEGESLQKSVVMKGVLPYWRFLNIFEQACSALGHAHSRGVIHRDIKPSNILISTNETGQDMVRIVDFGIAKIVHKDGSPVEDLTRTGDLVGSPLYMSPEQCMGNTLDPRSDIYSLGCVMYFAITGATPFVGKNAVQTIFKHLHEMPTRPADLRPDVPELIEQIIFRAVQKHPDQRFSGAEEMMAALQRAREMGVGSYM